MEVAAKCFYRRKDLPANLLAAADRHACKPWQFFSLQKMIFKCVFPGLDLIKKINGLM